MPSVLEGIQFPSRHILLNNLTSKYTKKIWQCFTIEYDLTWDFRVHVFISAILRVEYVIYRVINPVNCLPGFEGLAKGDNRRLGLRIREDPQWSSFYNVMIILKFRNPAKV
jgi:hypothetical protein